MRQLIRTYTITGLHEITITGYTFTKEDVRLIIDETLAVTDKRASVLVSSTAKNNIVSVVNGVITLANTTAELTVGDELTIEIDIDNIAKEANATSNKNEIIDALDSIDDKIGTVPVGSDKATIFAWLTTIYEYLAGQTPEDIPEGLGDRINLLLQFFGIAGTFEAEAVGQETTDNPVINECKTRYAEVFGDLLPSDFVMPNSVTIDGITYNGTVS